MSQTTCRIAECAEEIRSACDRLLDIAPVIDPESDLEPFLATLRLNAALMAGLGKSLYTGVSVRNTNQLTTATHGA